VVGGPLSVHYLRLWFTRAAVVISEGNLSWLQNPSEWISRLACLKLPPKRGLSRHHELDFSGLRLYRLKQPQAPQPWCRIEFNNRCTATSKTGRVGGLRTSNEVPRPLPEPLFSIQGRQ